MLLGPDWPEPAHASDSCRLQKELQGPEAREDQPDWPPAADDGADERGGERGHRPAEDTEDAGRKLRGGGGPAPQPCGGGGSDGALPRLQEAIIQIMKMRKRINNAQLQTELVEILKNMFLPQKKMIKEQIEWLIDHKYIKRDESDINTFIYMA